MEYFLPRNVLAGFLALRPDPSFPELVHAGEFWAPTEWSIDKHTHDVWELYLQVEGTTGWEVANRTYDLQTGDLLAVPPRRPHRLCRRSRTKHHFVFVAVDVQRSIARHPSLPSEWGEERTMHLRDVAHVQIPFRQLNAEICHEAPFRPLGLQLIVDYIILEVSRLLRDQAGSRSIAKMHPAVRRVKSVLETAYHERWQLADLAKLGGVSPNHLVERFTQEVGIPPHQYLLNMRIDRAKEMLEQSDMPITVVALELGFCSSQHFARTFRRKMGTSAQAFRKTRL